MGSGSLGTDRLGSSLHSTTDMLCDLGQVHFYFFLL